MEEIPENYIERLGAKSNIIPKKKPQISSYKPPTAHRSAQIKIPEKKTAPPVKFNVGDMVNHKKWGLGTIMEINDERITISFVNPEYGVKVLGINAAPLNKI